MSNPTAPKLALADAIRALAMDAVQQANSGHPGAPMGMAEIAQALWAGNLRHNPKDPAWANRDRFVLSNGHGSMLIYALLHLTGYDLPIEELKNFRQLHSKTPGHPEVGITPGVETTTGPLGQGLGNAVGMALAEALLAAEFNKPGHTIVDHHTYAFTGDGCLMEGISHEVCSLAGTLKLGKLVVLYDDNGISIDGHVEHWFADDTAKRFEGYGWNVIRGIDGHDVAAVDAAIKQARSQSAADADRLPHRHRQGLAQHGRHPQCARRPAGQGRNRRHPRRAGLVGRAVPDPASHLRRLGRPQAGRRRPGRMAIGVRRLCRRIPAEAAEFKRRMKGELPAGYAEQFKAFLDATLEKAETVATRKASQFAITALAPLLPEMLGGSADLTGSNFTDWKGVAAVRAGEQGIQFGRHINYGVREFGMAAIMNGVALHGGYLPFGGTFLTFSDYSRNAIRMAALMKQRVVHVFTHDSIGLGEDGPTHQSIEHAASLRLIPNLSLWRPCDTAETAVAWNAAVTRPTSIGMDVHDGGPTALLLSRQNLPFVQRDAATVAAIARGGYVLRDADGARAVIIATGSEVAIALDAQAQLAKDGIAVRVVSMPSTDVFDKQDAAWKQSVLPKGLPRVAVEAGVTAFWHKYVGLEGAVVGIDRYGESAPAGALFKFFGLTADKVAETVKQVL